MSAGPGIAEDDVQAYVDGALPPDRRIEVERRLSADPETARRVAALVRQRAALRAALAPIAAEPIPDALNLGRLLADARREPVEARGRPRWRTVATAVALLAVGGVGGWSMRGAVEPPATGLSALAGEASATYAAFVENPTQSVEAGASGETDMLRWIAGRLHRTVRAFDLTRYGFRFVGGRLVATQNGPAGMFLYGDDRGTRILVLTRPMAIEAGSRMIRDDRGGTKGFAWTDYGMGFSLVGPASAAELHPLADEIRRQVEQKA